jgi:hypothetical protein
MLPDLCPHCDKCRRIVSGKGSLFFLCEVSFADARYPKYPRQPVTRCLQFVPLRASANIAVQAATVQAATTAATTATITATAISQTAVAAQASTVTTVSTVSTVSPTGDQEGKD